MTALRLGTRRSALAVTQSGWVADRLRELGERVELVEILTEGDQNRAALTEIGGTGVFVATLRTALHEGRVDLAVHSMKDLPVAPEPGLVVAAVPVRADPRDVLVARGGRTLADLEPGARIGTGSPRREAQLAAFRPDLQIFPIRGNVDTRLRLVREGRYDAVVLAHAGLARLGRSAEVSEVLSVETILPAPGQGALAVECRENRSDVLAAVATLDDPDTRCCVTAERALLDTLQAGCTAPIGALAELDGADRLRMRGFAGTKDGLVFVRLSRLGVRADPLGVGRDLGADIRAEGSARFGRRFVLPGIPGLPGFSE